MARLFREEQLMLASHNSGKVREIAELLAPYPVTVLSASELGLEAPAETGITFAQNAELKATSAATATGLPALADDSGLAVTALNGRPGVRSARWAGPGKDFDEAMCRIHEMMEGHPDASAKFVCVLSICWPDGHCENFEGRVAGTLVWPPRGENGFGYDPMFMPKGYAITFGEMDASEKHAISHRANAFRKLIKACFKS